MECSLEQAVQLLLANTTAPHAVQTVHFEDALGCVSAQDVNARISMPPFPRSPLDGYAVRHGDIQGASQQTPAVLRVVQGVYAGDAPQRPLRDGEAARIMTGAPIPDGATCVVRQEDTDEGGELVRVYQAHSAYENYCRQGEDVARGQPLFPRGQRLQAAHLSVLAGQGIAEIQVYGRPCVGILTTGSELTAVGAPLGPGKIYDSNQYYLSARVRQLGGRPSVQGGVADEPQRIATQVEALFTRCDLVITTGGVSVGEHDYMPAVSALLGMEELFHGVLIKPGGPAMACRRGNKLLLCLSGPPFAAVATFELLARPVILRLCGDADVHPVRIRRELADAFPKASRGRRLIRARLDSDGVHLPRGHSSGMLVSAAGCNCLADLPAGTPPLEAGALVDVILL